MDIPEAYRDLIEVFNKIKVDKLPPHRLTDSKIVLQKKKKKKKKNATLYPLTEVNKKKKKGRHGFKESLLVINYVVEVSFADAIVLCVPTRSQLKKLLKFASRRE